MVSASKLFTTPVRMAQFNAQHSSQTITTILNKHCRDIDVLFLQEPNWAGLGNDENGKRVFGPVKNGSWSMILPVESKHETDPRPRVMVYFRPNPTYQLVHRTDIVAHPDIMVIDIVQEGQPTTCVVNLYNDPERANRQTSIAYKLRHLELPHDRPIVLGGDWNLKHPLWSKDDERPTRIAAAVVDWLDNRGFTIMNEKGVATWHRQGQRQQESVIDLTFCNAAAVQADTVKEWALDPGISYGSDHTAVRWTLDPGVHEVDNICGLRYNMKDVAEEDWVKAFEERLEPQRQALEPLLSRDRALQPANLDACVRTFQNVINETTAATAKVRKPSASAKPWWDRDLSAAADNIAVAKDEQTVYLQQLGAKSRALHSKIRKAKNFFRRLLKFKKQEWANETLAKANGDEIWSFREWSKGARNYPSPAIDRGPNRPRATTHDEKCQALRDELYQPPPVLPHPFNPDLTTPHADDIAFEDVTETEVREALFSSSSTSAPGDSQATYQVIKWAWSRALEYIVGIVWHAIRGGYHPEIFRLAIAVALRKPGKPDYSQPRAYRLITLLECLGKVIEKVAARRFAYLAGKFGLVPPQQFGGCANSSTTDAMLAFVNDVHSAWNNNLVTSALTIDIKGYFDFVNHGRLLHVLRKKGIPLPMVRWVASFLSDRQAAVCIDGMRGKMAPVENGIPQGSPVSPILAAFYSAELIEQMQEPFPGAAAYEDDTPTAVTMFMYVDDGIFFVSSKSLQTNVKLLDAAYGRAARWMRSAGLAPDVNKRELMHYSRRKLTGRREEDSPSMTFIDDDGKARTISAGEHVRWLGVHFDRRLSFNYHVQTMAGKAGNAAGRLAMLANTVRGLSQVNVRRLYQACVVPVITYAAAVWWPNKKGKDGKLVGKKQHEKDMERVQRKALRIICAAFKTTPISALEVEASIAPIRHTLDQAVRQCALRFNKLSLSSPIVERLPDDWRQGQAPAVPPPLPPRKPGSRAKTELRKTTPLQATATHTNPQDERISPYMMPPWRRTAAAFGDRLKIRNKAGKMSKVEAARAHQEYLKTLHGPSTLVAYADGSQQEVNGRRRVGAGLVVYHDRRVVKELAVGLGPRAEVYDGEMAALMMTARALVHLAEERPGISNIAIFSDNSAAVDAICDPKPRAAQLYAKAFYDSITTLLDARPELSVEVCWCPGHQDVAGNERADKLAKAGTAKENSIGPRATRAYAGRRCKEKTLAAWTKEWRAAPRTGRYAISNRIPPSLKPTKHFTALSDERETFGRLVQSRTGHCFSGEYYAQFVPDEDVDCPCGEQFQSREHVIRHCARYERHRHILRAVSRDVSLPEILGTASGIEALSKFLRKTGAFTKTGEPRAARTAPRWEDETEDYGGWDDDGDDGP